MPRFWIIPALLTAFGASTIAYAANETDDLDGIELNSLAGAFLAGRSAELEHDLHAAATFFTATLDRDPRNPILLERVVTLYLAIGDMEKAGLYASRMVLEIPDNPISRVALGVLSLREGDAVAGRADLEKAGASPLAALTAGLIEAWTYVGEGDIDTALETIDALSGPSWYEIFKDYHTALVLDADGRTEEAVEAIERAYGSDNTALRIVDSYARIMARAGQRGKAIDAVVDFAGAQPLHPLARTTLDMLRSGTTPPPVADDMVSGAAEVLYGLGSAIGTDNGPELAASYLQLARHLNPQLALGIMAIGDVMQDAGRCEEAIDVYRTVDEDEPLRRNADIQIGNCLEALERYDEAAEILTKVVSANPDDYEAAIELGNVFRRSDRFAEAADAYSAGIASLPEEALGVWRIFYFRGIAYERSKQWALAEPDFQKALELNPDQPQVLNYLGYSWVDMGLNLEPALDMIRKAVELRPRDGYIVDSLGWAYYRLGRYEDAVIELERAVALQPEDPVINDHLGDAFWQVGRKREAVFQWKHARDLEPEDDDLQVILRKIEVGFDEALDDEPAPQEKADQKTRSLVPGNASPTIVVAEGDSLWTLAERYLGDGNRFEQILGANPDVISDADHLRPGMKLVIPAPDTN